MNVRWIVLCTVVATGVAARVQAEPPKQALHWARSESASDCVDPRTLSELVETYTGPIFSSPTSAESSIEGEIEQTAPDQFRVRLSVTQARGRPIGQRVLTLPASDCHKLDGAIALVIATILDPNLGTDAVPPELSWLRSETPAAEELRAELASQPAGPAPTQATNASAAANTDAEPRATAPATGEPKTNDPWEIGAAATLGAGVVPKASIGGLLAISRSLSAHFALTLQLRASSVLSEFDLEAGRSVDVQTYRSALLAYANTSRAAPAGFKTCLGPQVGFFSAHGTGFTAAETIVQPSYGAELKVELRYRIADQLALFVGGLLDLGWRRPIVSYAILDAQPVVFRSRLYALESMLGLAQSF